MFCPFCGREFQERDSKYCPFCGQDLSSPDDPLIDKVRYSNIWKMRSVLIAGTLAILVMAAGLALALSDMGEEPVPDDPALDHNPEDLIIQVDENSRMVLGGDFAAGHMSAYLTISKQLMVTLDPAASEGCTHFQWVLRDELSNWYLKTEKDEPEMLWPEPEVGMFTIIAYCYHTSDDTEPAAVYSGSVHYQGDKTQHFSWVYDGRTFRVESTIPQTDQQKYSSSSIVSPYVRAGNDLDACVDFVVTDGSVDILQKNLAQAFERRYGTPAAGDYGYAQFMLSMVQSLGYSYDSMNHYQADYWAFPAETLFNACGDEEDLTFLYASLLKSAGYDCGLIPMPMTMMLAVRISDIPAIDPPEGHRELRIVHYGSTYILCEPYNEADPCLGAVMDCYGISRSGNRTYYYGEECSPEYCFRPLPD